MGSNQVSRKQNLNLFNPTNVDRWLVLQNYQPSTRETYRGILRRYGEFYRVASDAEIAWDAFKASVMCKHASNEHIVKCKNLIDKYLLWATSTSSTKLSISVEALNDLDEWLDGVLRHLVKTNGELLDSYLADPESVCPQDLLALSEDILRYNQMRHLVKVVISQQLDK